MVAALYYTHKPISRNLETVNNLDCTITVLANLELPRIRVGVTFTCSTRLQTERLEEHDKESKVLTGPLNSQISIQKNGWSTEAATAEDSGCSWPHAEEDKSRGSSMRALRDYSYFVRYQVLFMLLIICSVYDQQHMYVWCSYSYVNHLLHFVHFFFFSCPLCFVCFLICIWEVDLTVKPMLFVF